MLVKKGSHVVLSDLLFRDVHERNSILASVITLHFTERRPAVIFIMTLHSRQHHYHHPACLIVTVLDMLILFSFIFSSKSIDKILVNLEGRIAFLKQSLEWDNKGKGDTQFDQFQDGLKGSHDGILLFISFIVFQCQCRCCLGGSLGIDFDIVLY